MALCYDTRLFVLPERCDTEHSFHAIPAATAALRISPGPDALSPLQARRCMGAVELANSRIQDKGIEEAEICKAAE